MLQQQVYILNNVRMTLDAICVIGAGYAAYYTSYEVSGGIWSMDGNIFVASVMIVMFLNNYIMGRMHLYSDARFPSLLALWSAIGRAVGADFAVLATGIFLFKLSDYPRDFLLYFAGYSMIFVSIYRLLERLYIDYFAAKGFNVREILVVGNLARGQLVSDLLAKQLSWGHEVVGRLAIQKAEFESADTLGTIEDMPEILKHRAIDEVVFAIDGDRNVNLSYYLNVCQKMGIPARILPALWKPGDKSLSVERCQGVPFLTVPADNLNATGLMYKRVLDIAGGLVGTVLFLAMYPFVGLAVKLDTPGPVLFVQERIGQNGRVFKLFKFRTMGLDAEERKNELAAENVMNGAMFKVKNDPRITRVGKWLRKTSLDEFPQFINVLKGEMSLVGTRPPTVDEVDKYKTWHRRRISAKPGITGLWQISGRNKITDFDTVVKLDCEYLDNWRFIDDIKILCKTIWVVLQRKGAI